MQIRIQYINIIIKESLDILDKKLKNKMKINLSSKKNEEFNKNRKKLFLNSAKLQKFNRKFKNHRVKYQELKKIIQKKSKMKIKQKKSRVGAFNFSLILSKILRKLKLTITLRNYIQSKKKISKN